MGDDIGGDNIDLNAEERAALDRAQQKVFEAVKVAREKAADSQKKDKTDAKPV